MDQVARLTLEAIYDSKYTHDDAYAIAGCPMELDELMQRFRRHHIFLIHRSMGMAAASLEGRSVDLPKKCARERFIAPRWGFARS